MHVLDGVSGVSVMMFKHRTEPRSRRGLASDISGSGPGVPIMENKSDTGPAFPRCIDSQIGAIVDDKPSLELMSLTCVGRLCDCSANRLSSKAVKGSGSVLFELPKRLGNKCLRIGPTNSISKVLEISSLGTSRRANWIHLTDYTGLLADTALWMLTIAAQLSSSTLFASWFLTTSASCCCLWKRGLLHLLWCLHRARRCVEFLSFSRGRCDALIAAKSRNSRCGLTLR
jgi:hypothetical protein